MKSRTFWESLWHAVEGVGQAARTQRNAQIELTITGLIIALGVYVGLDLFRWAVIVLTIGFVLAAEWFNSSIEALTDLTCPDYHELAKRTKDVSAAGVLIASVVAAAVGLLILGPPLWHKLF
jgi:diacylglycerol kinase